MKRYYVLAAVLLVAAMLAFAGCTRHGPGGPAAVPSGQTAPAAGTAAVTPAGTPAGTPAANGTVAAPAVQSPAANTTAVSGATLATPAPLSPADLARIGSELNTVQSVPEAPPSGQD